MRRISHTPQGGTTAVNAAGGTLMKDQGLLSPDSLLLSPDSLQSPLDRLVFSSMIKILHNLSVQVTARVCTALAGCYKIEVYNF